MQCRNRPKKQDLGIHFTSWRGARHCVTEILFSKSEYVPAAYARASPVGLSTYVNSIMLYTYTESRFGPSITQSCFPFICQLRSEIRLCRQRVGEAERRAPQCGCVWLVPSSAPCLSKDSTVEASIIFNMFLPQSLCSSKTIFLEYTST